MNAFLTVFRFEIRDRRMLLLAGIVSGLFALALPFLPGLGQWNPSDIRLIGAASLAGIVALAGSVLIGGSIFVRDLAERRGGFWFSRPVAGPSLWGGKLLAAVVVLLGSAAAAFGPSALVHVRQLDRSALLVVTACLAAALGLTLVSNVVVLAVRSRSHWAAVDGAALLVTAVLFWIAVRPAAALLGRETFLALGVFLVPLELFALLVASFRQVSVGRSDVVAAHRASSLALWGILLPVAAASIPAIRWYLSPGLDDLRNLSAYPAGSGGGWLSVGGSARFRPGLPFSFLFEPATGRSIRIQDDGGWTLSVSENGSTAVWLARDAGSNWQSPAASLQVVDLTAAQPRAVESTISTQNGFSLALSPDGHRVAIPDGKLLNVYELPSGRQLAAVRLPEPIGDVVYRPTFVTADDIRLLPRPFGPKKATRLRLFRLDVASKTLSETGALELRPENTSWLRLDPTGSRLLVEARTPTSLVVSLHDGLTGALLRPLVDEGERTTGGRSAFLPDGRILIGTATKSDAELRILAADGTLLRTAKLPHGDVVRVGNLIGASEVMVSVSTRRGDSFRTWDWKTVAVDVETGDSRLLAEGLVPTVLAFDWYLPLVAPSRAPDAARSLTFIDPKTEALVRVDAKTGVRTPLLGGR